MTFQIVVVRPQRQAQGTGQSQRVRVVRITLGKVTPGAGRLVAAIIEDMGLTLDEFRDLL